MMVPESLHNEQHKRECCTLNHGKYGTMVQEARCSAGKTGVLYAKSREIRYDGAGRCMKMYEYVAGQKQ